MNPEKAALFLYSLEMLFGNDFNQKNVIFKTENRFFKGKFYDTHPFDESVNKMEFKKSFEKTFLDSHSSEYEKQLLQQDIVGTFKTFETFVTKSKVNVSDRDIVPRDVQFLDMPETIFPFLILDSKEMITPVSLIVAKM